MAPFRGIFFVYEPFCRVMSTSMAPFSAIFSIYELFTGWDLAIDKILTDFLRYTFVDTGGKFC